LIAKAAVTSPSTWVAGHGPSSRDGEVVDAVAVLDDLALVAEAIGEGWAVRGRDALENFDGDAFMTPGPAWAGIAGRVEVAVPGAQPLPNRGLQLLAVESVWLTHHQ
jgi:hypothetical protein